MAGKVRWTIRRLFALWRVHGAMDLMWMLRDVRAVLTFVISDLIVGVAAVTATLLLAERFHGIGRWTTPQVLFMLGYAMLVTGLPNILFNYNVAYISRRVGRGQLDHTLVQPQPIWMSLLTEGFAPFSASMELVPGAVLFGWAVAHASVAVTPEWIGILLLNLVASSTIVLAYTYMVGSLAFWAPRAAEEISTSSWRLLDGLKSFPLDGANQIAIGGLLSVVPVGFIAWYPSRALLGLDGDSGSRLVTPLAAVVAVGLAVWVFRRGLRQYGRTGSQRYLSFGHRR